MTKKSSNNEEIAKFVNYLKEKDFIYSGSEIYGGLSNTWDFGPLGSLLKQNLKNYWIKKFIIEQNNNYFFDSSIMLNNGVWKASGHVDKFNDPMIDCKECKNRFRADHLVEEITNVSATNLSNKEMFDIIDKTDCPVCKKHDWTSVREFKLMFETSTSKTDSNEESIIYLRPETAQGIFINFNNYKNKTFGKVPFGIGQVGKAFRNEITPGNFIFRTKEFEQMELEYYVNASDEDQAFEQYLTLTKDFLSDLGLDAADVDIYNVPKDELAHYSKKTIDFEFEFPFGKKELLGIANRGDFDLRNHSDHSGTKLEMLDENNEKYYPSVIETSMGVERLLYAILWTAYKNMLQDETNYLKMPQQIAPYEVVVLPLTKHHIDQSREFTTYLKQSRLNLRVITLEKGNIGKRYKRADEMGIPFAITIDDEFEGQKMVTIRTASNKEQIRIETDKVEDFFLTNK